MKCSRCGRENSDFHRYCLACGAPLEATPGPRGRVGLFPRVGIQVIVILIALGALVYWLSTMNLVGTYTNAEGGYSLYAAFVGRERLYAPDEGKYGFSESKVTDTFSEKTRRVALRLDAFHYSSGVKAPHLRVVVEKSDGGSWPRQEALVELPQNGCMFDMDVDLIDGQRLPPGRYVVYFNIVKDAEEPKDAAIKSIHFTVITPGE